MLSLLSPAKKLDFSPVPRKLPVTEPLLDEEIADVLGACKKLSKANLKKLMGLSDDLAALNYQRYQDFDTADKKPAILAFNGDTYVGLCAPEFTGKELEFAQEHIGILSGFYGYVRPLDNIRPYRLEMGCGLKIGKTKDLYDFWAAAVTGTVNALIQDHKTGIILNLASEEYIRVLEREALEAPLVDCVFREIKKGAPQIIGINAKRARGMMARYIVENRIDTPQDIEDFNADGYRFNARESNEARLVFDRG